MTPILEVMVPKYTFITVIYEDDYSAMTLQSRVMYMFLPPDMVDSIIIIDNSSDENLFNIDRVLPHYGSLDACVTVIRRRDLTPIGTAGWHVQQLLKSCQANFNRTICGSRRQESSVLPGTLRFFREARRNP